VEFGQLPSQDNATFATAHFGKIVEGLLKPMRGLEQNYCSALVEEFPESQRAPRSFAWEKPFEHKPRRRESTCHERMKYRRWARNHFDGYARCNCLRHQVFAWVGNTRHSCVAHKDNDFAALHMS
jgi:hypothetical protein